MFPTPRETSPFNLMQEAYRDDPWALLVGCILFNMVHGSKARPILEEFLKRWPNCIDVYLHNEKSTRELLGQMEELFRPLGFQKRRALRIWAMASGFAVLRPDIDRSVDVTKLHGIGRYGSDSFNIFCRGYLVEDVLDKELRNYVGWAKQKGNDEKGRHQGPSAI